MQRDRRARFYVMAGVLAVLGLSPGVSSAQTVGVVQGKVVESLTRKPIPGVQVMVTGTQRGTVTGADGMYRISAVPTGYREVRIEHIGFGSLTQNIQLSAGGTATADFEMKQAIIDLEQIVVTGVAGQSTRAKVPFSLERLTTTAMPVQSSNAAQMIQAKVAGATVVSGSGRPGEAPSILLRGPKSINANGRSQEPLFIVDGVILASSVADIDANDIESIEIVRGAAASSMYGSRAANGVVQITTYRGQNVADNSVRYSLRSEMGASNIPGRFNLTDKHQFLLGADGQFVNQSGVSCEWIRCTSISLAGQMALPGASRNEWNTIQRETWPGETYDHVDRFFRGGEWMTNNLSVSGRSGGTNYLVSYNRQNNEGVMPYHRGDLRHNFRLNLDQSVRPDLTVSASASYTRSRASTGEGQLFALTRMPAGVDLSAPDHRQDSICGCNSGVIIIKPDPFNDNINPLYTMSTTDPTSERGRYLGSAAVNWKPLDWFGLEGNFSFDRLDSNTGNFRPKDFRNLQGVVQGGTLNKGNSKTEGINAALMASFRRSFGDLNTNTQVRYSIEKEDQASFSTAGSQFTADGVWTFNNIPAAQLSSSSSTQLIRRDGLFVTTDLDFRDRYIINVLARQDGSSVFGPDERRHMYYRGSGAYRISEEDWFGIPGVDELKLRYSIGTAGNEPNFAAQYETYSVAAGAITPLTLGNRDLKPEFMVEQEFGVETLVLGRYSLEVNYATSKVKDQLLQVPSLAFTGFSSQWQNAGALKSNTWEASLGAQVLRTGNVTWNTRVLFDRTRHQITELNVPAYQTGPSGEQGLGTVFYIRPGEVLGTFYGFQFAENCGHLPANVDCSQFQKNDDGYLVYVGAAGSHKNGWQTYTDATGATKQWWGTTAPMTIRGTAITWGTPFQAEGDDPMTGERTTFLPLGTTTPKFKLGLANTVTYKDFSFYGLLESVQGFSIYNQPLQWATFQAYSGIMDQSDVPEADQKPTGYYNRLYGASGLVPSSAFVDDGSYIKLHELSMRYRVSRNMLDKVGVLRGFDGLSLSVIGRNLYTWTKYDGYDPDVGESGSGTGSAALGRVDGYNYPPFRTITFGIQLDF